MDNERPEPDLRRCPFYDSFRLVSTADGAATYSEAVPDTDWPALRHRAFATHSPPCTWPLDPCACQAYVGLVFRFFPLSLVPVPLAPLAGRAFPLLCQYVSPDYASRRTSPLSPPLPLLEGFKRRASTENDAALFLSNRTRLAQFSHPNGINDTLIARLRHSPSIRSEHYGLPLASMLAPPGVRLLQALAPVLARRAHQAEAAVLSRSCCSSIDTGCGQLCTHQGMATSLPQRAICLASLVAC
jgi:hypothetical protein